MFQQRDWPNLPPDVADWLALQRQVSKLPEPNRILVETFPHDGRHHICTYGFAGRNAMQTLGLLMTQRMECQGLAPMGFVSTDYAVLIWGLEPVTDPAPLFTADHLRDGFETWLAGNMVMKKTFKHSALISGLLDRQTTNKRRTAKSATFSADILYDTLRKYDPTHVLLQITREEALKGLVDFGRLENMLARTQGRVDHLALERVSPLAAPLFLEAGRVPIHGMATERLLDEAAADLMETAGLSLS